MIDMGQAEVQGREVDPAYPQGGGGFRPGVAEILEAIEQHRAYLSEAGGISTFCAEP